MPFILPIALRQGALGDVMSAETLDYLHGQASQGLMSTRPTACWGEKGLEGASLTEVIRRPGAGDNALFNNSAQL
jgi:superoxide dismutase